MDVVEIPASETHPLRRSVLRGGDPDCDVVFPEDARPGAFHLGVRDEGGELLGVASFSPAPPPFDPGRAGWQIRGMAVLPDRQRTGAGRLLLGTALDRVRSAGAEVVWANARDVAIPFYEKLGLRVEGEGFMAGPGGDIPHHRVACLLGESEPSLAE